MQIYNRGDNVLQSKQLNLRNVVIPVVESSSWLDLSTTDEDLFVVVLKSSDLGIACLPARQQSGWLQAGTLQYLPVVECFVQCNVSKPNSAFFSIPARLTAPAFGQARLRRGTGWWTIIKNYKYFLFPSIRPLTVDTQETVYRWLSSPAVSGTYRSHMLLSTLPCLRFTFRKR
jgi:hypothetical protein